MQAIKNISGSKTIIMITHRLETTSFCDEVYNLYKGEILSQDGSMIYHD